MTTRPMEAPVSSPDTREDFALNDRFKAIFGNHPAGVTVITADDGNGPVGLVASSVSSVSLDPLMVAFSLSAGSSSAGAILKADSHLIHFVRPEGAGEAHRLARKGSSERFADVSSWHNLSSGEPHIHAFPTWIRGRIVGVLPAGDSRLVLSQILDAQFAPQTGGGALVYVNREWHALGPDSLLDR